MTIEDYIIDRTASTIDDAIVCAVRKALKIDLGRDELADIIRFCRWIPATEYNLPPVGVNVLIYSKRNGPGEGCLNRDGSWTQYRWNAKLKHDDVTHWAWMPPIPRTEEETNG